MANRAERRANKPKIPGDVSVPRKEFEMLLDLNDMLVKNLRHTIPSWDEESSRTSIAELCETSDGLNAFIRSVT